MATGKVDKFTGQFREDDADGITAESLGLTPFEKTFDNTTDDTELSWNAGKTEATITHDLGQEAPEVTLKNVTTNLLEQATVEYTDSNTVVLHFGAAVTDSYYVSIGFGSGNVAAPDLVTLSGTTVTVNANDSDIFKFNPGGAASTVSFSNMQVGYPVTLEIQNGDTYVSFPVGIEWVTADGNAPALQAAGYDKLIFDIDSGGTIHGVVVW